MKCGLPLFFFCCPNLSNTVCIVNVTEWFIKATSGVCIQTAILACLFQDHIIYAPVHLKIIIKYYEKVIC